MFGGSGKPDFMSETKGAFDSWMSEASQYSGDGSAGHFTQVVWKASQRIGCGWNLQTCPDGNFYFFCEFDPYGNVIGEYSQNVA
jgi:Cysteine-rich secretory protein family